MEPVQHKYDIAEITDLLLPGNLICIAGRLDSGKTTLLQQLQQRSEAAAKGSTVLISPEHPHNDFDSAPYISSETIRQHLLKIQNQREIKLVLIDNLGLLDDVESDKGEGLKRLAVDLKLPVVVSCFLRRAADAKQPGIATSTDILDPTIERSVDVLLLLHKMGEAREACMAKNSSETGHTSAELN
jgi:replicative DNA helicase